MQNLQIFRGINDHRDKVDYSLPNKQVDDQKYCSLMLLWLEMIAT